MNDRKRLTASELTAVLAICGGCQWTADGLNALPLAARHHDATGHLVTVDLTRRVVYGDNDQALAASGQTTIEDALLDQQKGPTDGTTHR